MSATPPFVLMHRQCGYPAVYLTERPSAYALTTSSIVVHLDGRPMEKYAPVLCDTCGASFQPKTKDILPMVDS